MEVVEPVFVPVAVDVGPVVVAGAPPSLYNSNLFPAPQYSRLLPGQTKLQSVRASIVDVAASVLPQ